MHILQTNETAGCYDNMVLAMQAYRFESRSRGKILRENTVQCRARGLFGSRVTTRGTRNVRGSA